MRCFTSALLVLLFFFFASGKCFESVGNSDNLPARPSDGFAGHDSTSLQQIKNPWF